MSRNRASAKTAGARFERVCLNCGEDIPVRSPGRGSSVKKYCDSRCKNNARNAGRRIPAAVECTKCGETRVLLNPSLAGGKCRACASTAATAMAAIVNTQLPIDRFMAKVKILGSGCWEWVGSRQRNGYGTFGLAGKTLRAHRWSYVYFVGPIPSELEIDHLCRRRACVNPAHLEPVTRATNMARAREAHTDAT